ncbi:MAG: beta-ketoacyl synthase N-terminal-like domain-containing protein [Candidatus Omnitrophota bacterium]
MEKRQRIVITGIGPISSVGIGRENFWQGILNKKINIELEECYLDGELWDKFYYHKVKDFDINKFGIEKAKLADIRDWKEGEEVVDLNYLIAAVKLALDDSKLDYNNDNNGIGLVLAHENLGLMPFGFKISDLAYEMLIDKKKSEISKKDFYDGFYKKFLKSGYDIQTFADLFHIARVFNIHEYSLFINNACASGLYALETASQIIQSKQAKRVVVAASDNPEIYKYLWFRDLGIYAKDGIVKPFAKGSNGLVFGDGGVGIVIETLEGAQKRGATIYAEYLGGGFDLEGWKITVPQIGSKSYQKAMNNALKRSNLKQEDIDLVCPHGVGSGPIDYYESKAIADVFSDSNPKPLITTFKPYVGHNLGSSALFESAILLLSLQNNIIPETLNCPEVDPRFNITLVQKQTKKKLKTVMKSCCAFAGFNSAVTFQKV